MSVTELIGRVAGIAVGAVLIWAGFSKLRNARNWLRQSDALGVDYRLAAVVPWVELGVGVALATNIFRPWPILAAGLLLIAFSVVLTLRVLDGSRPPCACFGASSDQPIGPRQFVRNALLLGLVVIAYAA